MRGSGEKGAYADETAVCAFEGEARRASRGFPAAAKPRRSSRPCGTARASPAVPAVLPKNLRPKGCKKSPTVLQ